jgi:DNA-binding GntR family transcriptional regulator
LYRCWACNLAHHPTRAHIDEHKVIFDAAPARDADLLSQHLETTGRHLEAIVSDVDAEPSPLDTSAG